MKFSVCIPNFNYGGYVGETIHSALQQDYINLEVLVSDNKSTDNSWEVILQIAAADNRVKAHQNITNLGFAGNLDPASQDATGDYLILLSSDDLINPGALTAYKKLIDATGNGASVITSNCKLIDSDGKVTGEGDLRRVWYSSDIDKELSEKIGHKVYKVSSAELLKRCLKTFNGPFYFAPTCYRKEDYLKAGGYNGSRMMNPDKWFHLRLLNVTDTAYFIDAPLFSYRWHQNNQTALQKKSGALKYFVDDYRTSFEVDKSMLQKTGLTQDEVVSSFVYNVIHKFVFRHIGEGSPMQAFRILCFGFAAYPQAMFKKGLSYTLFLLILTGPLGRFLLKLTGKKFN